MVMMYVGHIAAYRRTRSPGRLACVCKCWSAFVKWTGWTLAVTESRWQHRKHCHSLLLLLLLSVLSLHYRLFILKQFWHVEIDCPVLVWQPSQLMYNYIECIALYENDQLMCTEFTCRQRERCDQFLTSATKSVVSLVDKNVIWRRCYEHSQASVGLVLLWMFLIFNNSKLFLLQDNADEPILDSLKKWITYLQSLLIFSSLIMLSPVGKTKFITP